MRRTGTLLAVFAVLLAACTAAPTNPGPVPTVTAARAASPTAAKDPLGSPVSLDAWLTTTLQDVRTGEAFTIADLAGKLVVVEPMAIWCTNCLHQQREASKALASLDSDTIVYISLDVDPTEKETDLAAYADDRGFDWRFVVAGRDLSRAMAQSFGDQTLSPPSTPKVIVTPAGDVLGPTFGIQDAGAIEAELRDHLS